MFTASYTYLQTYKFMLNCMYVSTLHRPWASTYTHLAAMMPNTRAHQEEKWEALMGARWLPVHQPVFLPYINQSESPRSGGVTHTILTRFLLPF